MLIKAKRCLKGLGYDGREGKKRDVVSVTEGACGDRGTVDLPEPVGQI